MIKPPYTKWINDIKAKLGFNRTMTASGEDVVDAVNKQAQQITDLGPVNNLNSDSTKAALAAAQGKALNQKIQELSTIRVIYDNEITLNIGALYSTTIARICNHIMQLRIIISGFTATNASAILSLNTITFPFDTFITIYDYNNGSIIGSAYLTAKRINYYGQSVENKRVIIAGTVII